MAPAIAWAQDVVARRTSVGPTGEYRRKLVRGLRFLDRWTGPPFGLQSLGVSLTLAFIYTLFCGILAFGRQGGAVGAVVVFDPPDWAGELSGSTLALALAVLMVLTGWTTYTWLRPEACGVPAAARPGGRGRFLLRIALAGTALGVACVLAALFGANPTAVACFMAVVAFAALALQGRRRAAIAGSFGGVLAGIVAAMLGEQNLVEGLATGVGMGLLVGGISGYCAAAVAEKANHEGSAALTGAGVGVAVASLVTITALTVAYRFLDATSREVALDAEALLVFLVVWVVFPLTNALIDYVSLGISHCLGLLALKRARSFRGVWFLAACDAVAALGLLGATVVVIAAGLILADRVVPWHLEPTDFFGSAAADPFGPGVWLSLMVLSTLLWTACHCAFVVAPAAAALASAILLQPRLLAAHRRDRNADRLSPPIVLFACLLPYATTILAALILALGLLVAILLFRHLWELLRAFGAADGMFEQLARLGLWIVAFAGS